MDIYITRHGQTEWNLINKIQGHLDSPLTEKGREDAKKLGLRLKNKNIDLAYSSDLKRAIDTAEIIIGSRDKVRPLKALREIGVGKWEGMFYEDIEKTYPEKFKAYKTNPDAYQPTPGGETFKDFEKRVRDFVEDLKNEDHDSILIVTHGLTYMMLLNIFEGKELKDISKRVLPAGTSLSHIKYENGKYNIIEENCLEHLS
ncbi:histidine phosphatase family protein [Neofamilia massiliensis]|uniref:histidine phosphatase family protein n=1 Tax=Neofamilia massiliensis TaxID=1673724 RepID=UPI0006BB8299|nr:histidine phosphatase family protein [Neofamilia massiliensis]